MARRIGRMVLALVLGVSLATLAHGHGGQPAPPMVSPPMPIPGAATPGPNLPKAGNTARGRPASLTAGASSAAQPTTGAVRGSASGKQGASTAQGTVTAVRSYDSWEFWWWHNRDRFLGLRERMDDPGTTVSGTGILTGRGRRVQTHDHRPTSYRVVSEVVPGLLEVLERSDDGDLLDSAVLGVGRTCDGRCSSSVLEAALPLLAHSELKVSTAATLALGVLGSPEAAELLREILADTSEGRRITGGGPVSWLNRSFAAVSLGLIGDPITVDALMDVVERLPDNERDVKVCAVVGLGLLGRDHPRAADVSAFLMAKLVDRRLDPVIQSYVPTSLAKLGNAEAVQPLLGKLKDRDTDRLVQQSCVIGLGRLASMSDAGVVEALGDLVEEAKDGPSRHFGLIALGSIGARDDQSGARVDQHDDLLRLLLREITQPKKSNAHRSWAGLAAAIYGRGQDGSRTAVVDQLRVAYDEESDPAFRGAFALALGLLGDSTSAERLHDDFQEARTSDVRGATALALGFLGHRPTIDPLRQLCASKGVETTLRLHSATALALMADRASVPVLVEALRDERVLEVRGALTQALGILGDQEAIVPLVDLAFDEQVEPMTRAFACIALGLICEKTELPWHVVIREDNNYLASVPSLAELLDIF